MEKNHYEVIAPSGKKWTLRALPRHFFLYFGQLPSFLTSIAVEGLNEESANKDAIEKAVKKMSQQEQIETAIFVREAVKFACVNPKISLTPSGADEISPFEISEDDFNFLSQTVMQNIGELNPQKKS